MYVTKTLVLLTGRCIKHSLGNTKQLYLCQGRKLKHVHAYLE